MCGLCHALEVITDCRDKGNQQQMLMSWLLPAPLLPLFSLQTLPPRFPFSPD